MGQKREEIIANRFAIAELLRQGKSIRAIAKELGVAGTTVQSVKKLLDDPNGAEALSSDRRGMNTRNDQYNEDVQSLIFKMREGTNWGPRMIWALLMREPAKYGLTEEGIPSPATIGRWLGEAGITRTNIGTRDNREYPEEMIAAPGTLGLDGHGPIHWTTGNNQHHEIYTITAIDNYTRAALSVVNVTTQHRMGIQHWIYAYYMGIKHLLGGMIPEVVKVDNGFGIVPTNGMTSQGMRHMMQHNTRILFIPPRMPWKNGRTERWHRTIQEEYWDIQRAENARRNRENEGRISVNDVVNEYIGWLNWYNVGRPHSGLRKVKAMGEFDQAFINELEKKQRRNIASPADLAPWYSPLEAGTLVNQQPRYEEIGPQKGIVDCIRLVRNDGTINLWNEDTMKINALKGNFVRVRFIVEPDAKTQVGQIIWQEGRAHEPLVVGTFEHNIDRKGAFEIKGIEMRRFEDVFITPPRQTITRSTHGAQGKQNWQAQGQLRQDNLLINENGVLVGKLREARRLVRHVNTSLLEIIAAHPELADEVRMIAQEYQI
jgi:transposase